MSPRALLLGVGSAAGVLVGRALDGLQLLPGVHESDAVRTIALAPGWTLMGAALSLLLGMLVDRLLPHRARAVAVLVGGQALVLATPELLGRGGDGHGEAPLVGAVLIQLLLSVLTVTTALLVTRLVLSAAPAAFPRPPGLSSGRLSYGVVLAHRRVTGRGGRAPPRGPVPATHS